MKPNNQLIS